MEEDGKEKQGMLEEEAGGSVDGCWGRGLAGCAQTAAD